MRYVGLTDDPPQRKKDHGDPVDWAVHKKFSYDAEARAWEKMMLAQSGYKGGTGGEGWRYGYTYTITSLTRE